MGIIYLQSTYTCALDVYRHFRYVQHGGNSRTRTGLSELVEGFSIKINGLCKGGRAQFCYENCRL